MANLQFLRGTQANLNKLNSATVQDGAFYLTTDTNRLYVGQGTDLVELNKSVTTVTTLADLPKTNIEEGQFYYVSDINVLCVRQGGQWVQINPDTKLSGVDSTITDITTGSSDAFDAKVQITDTFTQTSTDGNDANPTNTNKFETVNLKVEKVDDDTIRFTGDTYQVNVPTKTNTSNDEGAITAYNKEAQIELQRNVATAKNGAETVIKDTIKIVGDKGITSIIADADTQTITITPTTNASMSNSCENGTIILGVQETEGGKEVTTTFTPEFTYGNNEITTKFDKDYKVNFDVYTIDEIDKITSDLEEEIRDHIRANDAMTYKGTLTSFSSIGESLPVNEVSNGDVWMLAITTPVIVDGVTYKAGDFFIASGAETAVNGEGNSYIPAGQITWNYIPAGNDTYTTAYSNEAFQIVDGQNGNNVIGSVKVTAGTDTDDDIVVTPRSENSTSGGKNVTYTIKHKSQATTNHNKPTTATQEAANNTNGQVKDTKITVVDNLKVDANGHVTGWDNKTVTLIDTHNRIDTDESVLTITPNEDNTSAEVSTLLTMTDGDSTTYTYSVVSEATNIQITGSNTAGSKEIGLGLIWGSF